MIRAGEFQLAAGSIVGRDHLLRGDLIVGRPNQDGFAAYSGDEAVIAVVTDGCSSGDSTRKLEQSRNHVGAALGAKLFVGAVLAELRANALRSPEDVISAAADAVTEKLRELAFALTLPRGSFTATVTEYFLFTVCGLVITGEQTTVFSLGDGVYALNGVVSKVGPFPNNAPPYLGYRLIKSGFEPDELRIRIHESLPTAELQSVLLGSDGVADLIDAEWSALPGKSRVLGPLSQFWSEDAYFSNPDAIRRTLALANSGCKRLRGAELESIPGLLPDDTTIVAIRRAPESADKPEVKGG